jgi:hypothetical protein
MGYPCNFFSLCAFVVVKCCHPNSIVTSYVPSLILICKVEIKSYLGPGVWRIEAQGHPREQDCLKNRPSVVVDSCNSSCSGDRGRKIKIRGQPRQKHETLFEKQTKSKKEYGCGSNGTVLAYQAPRSRR